MSISHCDICSAYRSPNGGGGEAFTKPGVLLKEIQPALSTPAIALGEFSAARIACPGRVDSIHSFRFARHL